MQSLFLRGSHGRRKGRRWTWGGGEPVSPPPGKHATNAQPMHQTLPELWTPQFFDKIRTPCAPHQMTKSGRHVCPTKDINQMHQTLRTVRQELLIALVVKTPVCLHPRRPPRLDGTETSYMMLELLNNWAIPNFHDMRRLLHVFQRITTRQYRTPQPL